VASDFDFHSWADPRVDHGDGDHAERDDDPGFGDATVSFVEPAPDLTASEAVVMPDPFAALELDAAGAPVAAYVPDELPDDGPPDPEADFYELIL
jgi:hypothetical protein